MKTLFLLILFALYNFGCCSQDINPYTCTYKGKKLYGNVKVVNSNADFKVRIVNSNEDISIIQTNSKPDICGEWKFVDSYPDFTIQYVENFPDVKIKFVENFPGVK